MSTREREREKREEEKKHMYMKITTDSNLQHQILFRHNNTAHVEMKHIITLTTSNATITIGNTFPNYYYYYYHHHDNNKRGICVSGSDTSKEICDTSLPHLTRKVIIIPETKHKQSHTHQIKRHQKQQQ